MTLNGIMGIFCVISQNSVAFGSGGAHCVKVVEDTPIPASAEMSQKNLVLAIYHGDIGKGSLPQRER